MKASSESSNLDFLRASAVMFVVLFHLLLFYQHTDVGPFNLHSLGHLGVLLFFVHTSLVLMFSLERQIARNPNAFFGSFYARRCFRIFPLSILVVLAVDKLKLPVGHLRDGIFYAVRLNHEQLLANLLLVQNVAHTDSIIAPLWSLPYELQMYVLLPFLFLLARRTQKWFWLGSLWLVSAALGLAPQYFRHAPDFLIYVPCFMAGVLAYQLTKSQVSHWPFAIWPALLGLLSVFYLQHPSVIRSWIACLVVGISIPQFREMQTVWLKKSFHEVARYSYGLYLTHFICIWLAFSEFAHRPLAFRWLVFFLTLIGLPIVFYHLVESPMIVFGNRLLNRTPSEDRAIIATA